MSDRISKPVSQYDTDGNHIKTFPSIRDAEVQTKIKRFGIREVCNAKRKTAGGYKWSFTEEENIKNTTTKGLAVVSRGTSTKKEG